MDNKIKYAIIALAVIIIAIIAASSFLGNSADDDPTHLVVTAPGHAGEPETGFDPLTGWGCGHLNFNPLVQSTLLTSDENGSFVNDLATGYNISSDGLTWTVGIRDDVKFSNNESWLKIPRLVLSIQNLSSASGFVKISANCSSDLTN